MLKPKPKKKGFWRLCRICFRGFRISVWLLILALLGGFIYVNQIGLPEFVKQPLLEKLRARGVDLQFSRLRWRWYQGIVAENVRFGKTDDPLTPQLAAAEVKVSLDHSALARFKLQVDALTLRQGRLVWPIAETNGHPRQLAVESVQTGLRFLPGDQWALDQFNAVFAGVHIRLSGLVTNASAVRDWEVFSAKHPAPPGTLQHRLRLLADTLEKIQFSGTPDLNLELRGDARDLLSFHLRLDISAPGATTPWGAVTDGRFLARLLPSASNQVSRAELSLKAAEARSDWASATNLSLLVHVATFEHQTNLVNADLNLSAGTVDTRWGDATNAQFAAQWVHALNDPIPLSGRGHFQCGRAETKLADGASAKSLEVTAQLAAAPPPLLKDESWGWWTNIAPYALGWECRITGLSSPKFQADLIAGGGSWRAPELAITNLHAELYGAQLDASAGLDIATRALSANIATDLNAHKVEPLLTEAAQTFLQQFAWQKPPQVTARVALTLPAWTNNHPDWRAEVQPGLRIEGEFKADQGGAFRGLAVSAARSHFSYSDMLWRLPDLTVTRPEGGATAFHEASDRTKEFYWHIRSSIDVGIMRPLLETNQQTEFNLVSFTQPPHLDAEVWGRFHEPESVRFRGTVAATNFTLRGEWIGGFQTALSYTNKFLLLTDAHVQRDNQVGSAESLGIDITAGKLYLTNGFSTLDPAVVTRAIGPKVALAVDPYRFGRPPTARVHGVIPTHNESDADLYFELDGGPFHWLKFNADHVTGNVHWKGDHLSIDKVRAELYGGITTGSAGFDFSHERGTDFQFDLAATNVLLQLLMADVSPLTNNLEGRVSGSLIVNKANSADWRSWQGGGDVQLKDGLIWEIPIFGIFSPVLNGLSPGLGNTRASAAAGTFSIVNGIIHSDDLDIRAPAMRLQYRGTVDLQGQVNARVDSEMLRDVWLIGPIFSTVLWPVAKMFEYKLTGSLTQPKTEMVHLIPKIALMPFHPLRSLKEILPEDSSNTRTNAPP